MFQVLNSIIKFPFAVMSGCLEAWSQTMDEMQKRLDVGDTSTSNERQPPKSSPAPTRPSHERRSRKDEKVSKQAEPPEIHVNFRAAALENSRTVYFQNRSLGVESFSWSFGDGKKSSKRSPDHTYAEDGSYQVRLTGSTGDRSMEKIIEVSPDTEITPDSEVGSAPFVVMMSYYHSNPMGREAKKNLRIVEALKSDTSLTQLPTGARLFDLLQTFTSDFYKISKKQPDALRHIMGDEDDWITGRTRQILEEGYAILVEESSEERRDYLWRYYNLQVKNLLLFMKYRVWDIDPVGQVTGIIELMEQQIPILEKIQAFKTVDGLGNLLIHRRLHDHKPVLSGKVKTLKALLDS